KIMGDMKTPDFDDLLAAFDIPDMVDPKAAIESGHDDHDGQLKQSVHSEEESQAPSAPDVGVSVIVKNIRNIEVSEHALTEKEIHPSLGNGLQNGFLAVGPNDRYGKDIGKNMKEEGHGLSMNNSSFNQFSPISSAEEFDDDDKIEVDDPLDKKETLPGFGTNLLTGSAVKGEQESSNAITGDMLSRPGTNGDFDKSNIDNNNSNLGALNIYDRQKPRKTDEQPKDMVPKSLDLKESGDVVGLNMSSVSQAKAKSSAKLSSCIAAIAALSAKKATTDPTIPDLHTFPRDLPMEPKESPRVTDKPADPEPALELVKKMFSKQPESPCSVTSESSSKGSPSSPAGSIPVIPKVRIKTIKTSSGQIKRTVTRVLPEFDPDGLKKGTDATSIVVSSFLSSSTSTSVFSSPSRTSLPTTVVATSASTPMEVTKQMTIKPVATAFLPVSAVKTAGSQVINLKLANNTTVKATVIPAASVQSASSAILKAANAIQQQTVMVPASSLANAKLVPKTVHLTNLNLLPQTSSNTSELHQVLAKPQQPIKQTLIAAQPPKKVSRVQVLASSQSSVVEAFNKVLSSINPVPVYVPNLSPPSAACISIPSRGYKCLECGDSFALEKSLTQHYDRRSVRIEVTCNHCTKNLVFYNKCSLLSHARGHKDKGVVMQCSHLILKPIPADQMIASALHSSIVATTTIHSSMVNSAGKPTPAVLSTVISAPSTAPVVAAMPLEEDSSRLCRHSLKCLECSEMFQDEASLAMHYQQAVESSGQKTCNICQMLLPNQCSFVSHQRIHQHKSPYICPECGAICRSVHFQTHVTKNCLHYTRRVGYRCIHCSVIYADVAALKSHIQGTHCEIFYKCPICPMAFKSAPGTHSHAYTQHPGVKIGEPKLIYKCSMCDTVFTQQTLLYSHFDQHIANQKVSVFKCPDCSMHYAQKQLMLDHIKSMHGTLKTVEGPPNLGINLPLTSKPTNPMTQSPNKEVGTCNGVEKNEKKPQSPLKRANTSALPRKPSNPGWMCRECDRLFTQREVYISHMKREHGKQMKKHPCRQCDKSFSSSHSLCRHNRIKHKGLRKVYSCPHCPDPNRTFSKRLMLEKHIQLMHGIKEGKAVSDTTSMEDTSEKEFAQASSPKRKLEECAADFAPRGASAQPLKKLKINVFKVHKCAVCSFTTEDIMQFHEHIPQHKSDGSSHQCRECGLCYTSHNSLSRHLFIVHKLKEPQGLSRHNGAGDEDQQENQPSSEDAANDGASERKCKVCSKTFETEGALNTHMRTHGMAFIKSKRLNMADK
uniref:Zinc finger protein 532 n=1 Tax=Scleropages formosus TaxID=113540 RepID=A0A8C9SFH0_SCLFO